MKYSYLNRDRYPSPDVRVVDIEINTLICESETSEVFEEEEVYDDGNGWQ